MSICRRRRPRVEKLAQVRKVMAERNADWHFIATLDDIAWLFNLRGSDVSYNPVFISFAVIGPIGVTLFVDAKKVPDAVRSSLEHAG